MRCEISPRARLDLREIGDYIAQDNPRRAVSFIDELVAHCHRITSQPGIGVLREELARDLRMQPHGRYLIFYRVEGEVVSIIRVLHGARDVGHRFDW